MKHLPTTGSKPMTATVILTALLLIAIGANFFAVRIERRIPAAATASNAQPPETAAAESAGARA